MTGSNERADTQQPPLPSSALLWLLASFGILVMPQVDRLPLWLVASCAVLAGWRWLAQSSRVRLPGRAARLAVIITLVAAYVATVKESFSVDTAASFFVLAVSLKWLECRSTRDYYVLFFILVYLGGVNFLFRQEIYWALVNFVALAGLLIGLQLLNAPDLPHGVASGWRRLGGLMFKTLPIVVLLFIFFPRMAPLWSVPLVSSEARSGISETMKPGDISNLAKNDERAFRVTFGGETPAHRDRYWRGLILDYLDGETWRQSSSDGFRRPGRVANDGGVGELQSDEYEVLLEPTDQRWAFALAESRVASRNVVEESEDLFRFRRPADTTVRYRLAFEQETQASSPQLSVEERQRYLQLPDAGNPRARELAASFKERLNDAGMVETLLSRFRDQPYYYTLRPPRMAEDGIDTLLFDVRRGFCAHYAGATTFVLRAAGVPARVVVGYQGGEPVANNDYLIVRQYDAHAWVEVWLDGQGWVRLDPTAAIAPSRIESGLRDAVAEEGSFLEDNWASPERYSDIKVVRWFSHQLDRINYNWQRWVVGYQGESQMDLLSRLPGSFGLKELGYISAGIVGVGLLIAALFSALRLKQLERKDDFGRLIVAWHRLCNRTGVPVRAGDTPIDLASKLASAAPEVSDTARLFAQGVNSHYYKAGAEGGSVELARLRRLLATMKKQLRHSRSNRNRS
ncbi:transglutaminaseTgpA domain-containing protein [Marinobacter sp. F4216]|uniref:transglutaminase family protein n=1 Tax=Marinobacter sp. F4216 TaxID=2874281 RepID=UPI001CBCE372|nr:transglutaminaseTgpA domain-containing protein [Marinobacter sp. F4216]MBZ2167921.1 transglutaminaseTgpA domain-containing protein [Marinobacter sp. F4216]